jgi:hypothetical protein
MGRRSSTGMLWLMLIAVVFAGAGLYVLFQVNSVAVARTVGALIGMGIVASIILGLKSRSCRSRSLDQEADDFLKRLERGQDSAPDKERG